MRFNVFASTSETILMRPKIKPKTKTEKTGKISRFVIWVDIIISIDENTILVVIIYKLLPDFDIPIHHNVMNRLISKKEW